MRRFGPLVSATIFVAALAGIIYPAFIEVPSGAIRPPSPTQILVGLFLQPELTLAYFMRVLFFVAVLISAYIFVVNLMYRNLPITVVQTRIKMDFSPDYAHAVIRREQILRANQPNVTAYRTEIRPIAAGTTPRTDINVGLYCPDQNVAFNEPPLFKGSDQTGYEVLQRFGRNMPYKWYVSLIPSCFLRGDLDRMIGPIKNNLVKRTQTSVYKDAFLNPDPTMSFIAASYPQRNISMELNFQGKVPSTFYAIRIKNNGVVDVKTDNSSDNSRKLSVDSLQNEALRFGWLQTGQQTLGQR
jgi:hypothetical protein